MNFFCNKILFFKCASKILLKSKGSFVELEVDLPNMHQKTDKEVSHTKIKQVSDSLYDLKGKSKTVKVSVPTL